MYLKAWGKLFFLSWLFVLLSCVITSLSLFKVFQDEVLHCLERRCCGWFGCCEPDPYGSEEGGLLRTMGFCCDGDVHRVQRQFAFLRLVGIR